MNEGKAVFSQIMSLIKKLWSIKEIIRFGILIVGINFSVWVLPN